MPIISAFPTGESTVDYTGPKSGLPSLEEGKVAYVTDEKRLYTGNADGTNTQIPNADDLSAHTSNKENPHGVTAEQVGAATKDLSNVVLELECKGSTMPSSSNWSSVTYGNGRFVAVGNGSNTAAYSTDGITWTAVTMPSSGHWISATYGNGRFVAVASRDTTAAYSTDGITWTAVTMPSSGHWSFVTYGNGKFVAVAYGSNTAAYSTDGITWTAATMPSSSGWKFGTYGNGKFVAVTDNRNKAAYSTDGITWTAVTMPSSGSWSSVTYGNGRFVAVGNGSNTAAYSTDGITWTAATLPSSGSWSSVTYGNGRFVAVAYSTDGITWTAATLPSSGSWSSVTYGNGRFVAVASNTDKAAYVYLPSDIVDRLVNAGLAVKHEVSDAVSSHNSATDAHADKFAAVNAAIGNLTPSACKVTLTASGWDSTAKTQSATVSGVLEDESKQLIMPMPAGTSMSAYNEAGIQMTAQAANTVTFTADTVPTADVEVWVVVQNVNDVTPIPTLDEASWGYISRQSLAGNAKNIWSVGDCKAVKLSGTASELSLNTTLYVYILDFDHDQSSADGAKDGITFGTFKTAATDGVDVCLVSGCDDDSDFGMNTSSTNAGGWKNSDMRYRILGSTNTQNGDATNTTATSPKANTLLSCFPAELRKVMRPMYIYSDNTGGGSDTASYVTGTLDYLPLLAEYEVHGSRSRANAAESTKQTQYAYFKNGSSKIKKRHDNTNSLGVWWCRSTCAAFAGAFCGVGDGGIASIVGVNTSHGVAPMFKV